MIRIDTLHKLKSAPTNDLVYVRTTGKLYRHLDGEWIEKCYFTVSEIAAMLEITPDHCRKIIRKLNLRPMVMRYRSMDATQFSLIARALKMQREEKKRYKAIRQKLNL